MVAERALGKPVKIDRLGALVYSVSKGFPVAQAGVRPGDAITAVDGHPVRTEGGDDDPHDGLSPADAADYMFRDAGTKHLRTVSSTDGKHAPSSE